MRTQRSRRSRPARSLSARGGRSPRRAHRARGVGGGLRRAFDGSVTRAAASLFALLLAVGCQAPPEGTATTPDVRVALAGEVLEVDGGVVASQNEISSRIGADVLAAGGNAVDAAIAVGFALAVTHPSAGNIGGGGFMVIRQPDGTATTFDFREKAPLYSHPEMFLDEDGEYSSEMHHRGYTAVGVPGTVAGFDLAHQRYGQADWAGLVEGAIAVARDGFPLPEGLAGSLANQVEGRMQAYPASVAKFSDGGTPYEPGQVWRQPDLARTLERIRDGRRDGFYAGETADLIVAEMAKGGGLITHEDLSRYESVERPPIRGTYRGYDVISMGPPSSGGTAIVQALNILEGFDLVEMGHNSPAYLHHVGEAMRLAFRDRARHLADIDFVDVPLERLTSKDYAEALRAEIDPDRAGVSSVEDMETADAAMALESAETTHYSVVDAEGRAVSVTYTLEGGYGSSITVEGGGFLLNNEMGDFNAAPGLTTEGGLIGTEPNLARPEKRMLSSMSPTILARDGELVGVIGTPGGRTIINTVLQLALNRTTFPEMTPFEVVEAGRIHHQWLPDRLTIEESLAGSGVTDALEAAGHELRTRGRQGAAHSIFVNSATGIRAGVPDPRIEGAAAVGY